MRNRIKLQIFSLEKCHLSHSCASAPGRLRHSSHAEPQILFQPQCETDCFLRLFHTLSATLRFCLTKVNIRIDTDWQDMVRLCLTNEKTIQAP